MARLSRITQLLFGSSAGANQMSQFGSLAAGTPAFTTNLSTIQSLSNFLTGWFGAVIGGNSPAIEDMNSLFLLAFSQLAYILQVGVSEYDAGTTYYVGDIAQDGAGVMYYSQTNSNLGNGLSSIANWSTLPLITIKASYGASTTIPSGQANTYGSMTVDNNSTWSVAGEMNVIGTLTVTGTTTITATGSGILRAL